MLETNIPSCPLVVDLLSPWGTIDKSNFYPYRDSFSFTMPVTLSSFSECKWYVLVPTGIGKEVFLVRVNQIDLFNLIRSRRGQVVQVQEHPHNGGSLIFLYISKYHPNA